MANILIGTGLTMTTVGLSAAIAGIGWFCAPDGNWQMNPFYLVPLFPIGYILLNCALERGWRVVGQGTHDIAVL
jgi:hypothetical protein